MKNGSIPEQLKMQERMDESYEAINKQINIEINQSTNISDFGLSSAFGIYSPEPNHEDPQQPIPSKKKRTRKGRSLWFIMFFIIWCTKVHFENRTSTPSCKRF